MKKKIYILDTNVLVHDPQALTTFKGAHIGLPITVLQELDHFKGENTERGYSARKIIGQLDEFRKIGSLSKGVELEDKTKITVLSLPEQKLEILGLPPAELDNQILFYALSMQKKGFDVEFVSKDLNMRVKADSLGLKAEDYEKEKIDEKDFYKGWTQIKVPAIELKRKEPSVLKKLTKDNQLYRNEYILLTSNRNPENYRVFRYIGAEVFRPVSAPKMPWPIGPRNPQQLMALDLLFDDSVQLVSLFGPAGTGKTFLALTAAMYKLLIERNYEKLLVARPIVPLGRDIGYLPGDIQEKLYSWMQPVRDNMEFIIHKSRESGNQFPEFTRGRRRRKKPSGIRANSIPPLDDLIKTNKISLEAITYMRGRSIPYQYILIDEVQNLTPHEVKTLVTRVGEGSKIILAGDPYQIDSPYLGFCSNGLMVASEKFKGEKLFGSVYLETSERSELSELARKLLD